MPHLLQLPLNHSIQIYHILNLLYQTNKFLMLDLPLAIVQNKTDPITRSIWSEELAKASDAATIAFVPDIDASDPCMADKGRWGTHAQRRRSVGTQHTMH